MLLTAIGYSAEARGYVGAGWDKQVLSDASIIGLLDGYNYNTNTYAPRQWVAVMFMNALTGAYTYGNIAPVVFNGLLTGANYDAEYINFGKKYFGLYETEGIIVANEYADLYGAKPLSSDNTELRVKVDTNKYEDVTFKNWSTDLTEIGEYRRVWAVEAGTKDKVVYVGDDGVNTEFMTGEATNLTTDSKFKSATGIKNGGEYFVNFDKEAFNITGNGDWLRVVDNDDDGYADYVFKTTFTMGAFYEVDSNDHAWLTDNTKFVDGKYELYEDAAEDDVVIYTTIDGISYIELAPSFSGEAQKYTYKNRTLTVDEADYDQSDIAFDTTLDYFSELELADKDIEYTYYKDFFNHIRLFGEEVVEGGNLVLLTDAYYQTGRNGSVAAVDAYLDGEIKDTDVRNSASYTDINMFINGRTSSSNAWNKLRAFEAWKDNTGKTIGEGKTVLARYSLNDEGVISLYDAETWRYDNRGAKKELKTQYIDLHNNDIDAGTASYYGYVADIAYDGDADPAYTNTVDKTEEVRVQANRDTVFYYVSYNTGSPVVKTVTGYKNTFDVINSIVDVRAIYAVATDVSADAAEDDYWVADAIVIETYYPVFSLLTDDIVLGYDIANRAVSDYAYMDIVKADATLGGLNVISHNGDDFDTFDENGTLEVVNFFYNTVDEEGNSYVVDLTDYADNDIYVGKIDRIVKTLDYVVLKEHNLPASWNDELYFSDDTVVYDITENTRYNSIKEVTSGLSTGKNYIFFAPDGEIAYAILVADSLNDDGSVKTRDIAHDLYDAIWNPQAAAAGKALAKAQADAIEAYEKLIDKTAKVEVEAGRWAEGAAAAAKKASAEAIKAMNNVDALEAMTAAAAVGDAHWAAAIRPAVQAANAAAVVAEVDTAAELADAVTAKAPTIIVTGDITLADDTYFAFDYPVVIYGKTGAEKITAKGTTDYAGGVFSFYAGSEGASLSDLTINFTSTGRDTSAVYFDFAGDADAKTVVENVTFTGAATIAAIGQEIGVLASYSDNAYVEIKDCSFTNFKYAMYANKANNLVFSDNVVDGTNYAAVIVATGEYITVTDNDLTFISAANYNGDIYASGIVVGSESVVRNYTVTGNTFNMLHGKATTYINGTVAE